MQPAHGHAFVHGPQHVPFRTAGPPFTAFFQDSLRLKARSNGWRKLAAPPSHTKGAKHVLDLTFEVDDLDLREIAVTSMRDAVALPESGNSCSCGSSSGCCQHPPGGLPPPGGAAAASRRPQRTYAASGTAGRPQAPTCRSSVWPEQCAGLLGALPCVYGCGEPFPR
ncbi:thiazolylpeptide-type bacteriocin [Lentzea sp. NPDC004789]